MNRSVWWEQRKRKDTYSVRWYDPVTGDKKRLRVDGKDQRDKEINRIERDLLNWKSTDTSQPHAVPLAILDKYLTVCARTGRRATTIGMKRKHLTPFCSKVFRMEQVTGEYVQAWIDGMHKTGYKIDTICIRMRDVRAFLNWCVKEKILTVSPFTGIKIPASTFVGRRLTVDEMQSLLSQAKTVCRDYIVLALETGARRGELLQAEWNDIDFERRCWTIPGREGKSKSKRDRIVPLSPLAIEVLLNRKREGLRTIFQGYTQDMMYNDFDYAQRLAKIPGRIRPHDLRHTWASNFRGRASSLKAIAGWSTDQMMGHYTHVELEELREDMAKGNLGQKLGQIGVNGNA